MREKPKSTKIRINKFISQSGICSRREADNLIKKGLVFINGVKCDQLGKKISSKDKIEIKGKEIKPEKKIYILLNKPKDFITTHKDTHGRRTVFELLKGIEERVFHVGRLDRNTTGLLLFTNDGDLSKKEYENFIKDLVNFLVYVGEPHQNTRKKFGILVFYFLGVIFIFAYLLKKEYWKDVN